ncbi:hypothetical protein C0991_004432 [Blastosporella zonata]|nr:hypothetical protein C0991_004432 [Blastosporella zonata]
MYSTNDAIATNAFLDVQRFGLHEQMYSSSDTDYVPADALSSVYSTGAMDPSFVGQLGDTRLSLQELQKANVGRKCAIVDRRPIDPPPVVLLRLFRVYNAGTSAQIEEEVSDYG